MLNKQTKEKNTEFSTSDLDEIEEAVTENKNDANDKDEDAEEKKYEQSSKDKNIDVKGMINALSSCPLMIPFWQKILQCDRILIAGCGGGYDVFQGIDTHHLPSMNIHK